jgi:RNA polymerase sigma factor (sigma-70 family)
VTLPLSDTENGQWFAEEVLPHEPALRRYLCSMVETRDIDDVVQETYARLLRARLKGEMRSPRGLLFAIARNTARDLFRRSAVAKTTAVAEIEELNVLDDEPGVPEVVSRRQETELLTAAIRALPTRCREILILRKFENLSHKEIATRLGIAEHTVEAQLTKALHRCEEYFERNGALPPA